MQRSRDPGHHDGVFSHETAVKISVIHSISPAQIPDLPVAPTGKHCVSIQATNQAGRYLRLMSISRASCGLNTRHDPDFGGVLQGGRQILGILDRASLPGICSALSPAAYRSRTVNHSNPHAAECMGVRHTGQNCYVVILKNNSIKSVHEVLSNATNAIPFSMNHADGMIQSPMRQVYEPVSQQTANPLVAHIDRQISARKPVHGFGRQLHPHRTMIRDVVSQVGPEILDVLPSSQRSGKTTAS